MDTLGHKDWKDKKGRKENVEMLDNQDKKEIKEQRDRKETAIGDLHQPKEPYGHQLLDVAQDA